MGKDARLSVKDINERSTDTEVLHVQDKLVRDMIDSHISPDIASKIAWDRIRDRTGKDHKQARVKSP